MAYSEDEADDEYERSIRNASPSIGDSEASPSDSDASSSAHLTPTTFARAAMADNLPEAIVTEWTAEECGEFMGNLGLRQYTDLFLENEIVGEALVALLHDDLKQMGIVSVGHRLTILKSIYDIKVKQDIPLESDHYIPLSADAEAQYATATLNDIKQLVEQLRIRDERMSVAEFELRRITAEYTKLREDLLPVFRMAKEGQPLPYPTTNANANANANANNPHFSSATTVRDSHLSHEAPSILSLPHASGSNGLSRKFSTKKLFLEAAPKNVSPTYVQSSQERTLMEQALDPANAAERAVLSSSHLAAMNGGGPSLSPGPSPTNQPSPTTPPMFSSSTPNLGGSTLASRSYRSDLHTPAQSHFPPNEHSSYQASTYSRDSTKPAPSRRTQTPAADPPSSAAPLSGGGSAGAHSGGGGGASVEIFKSFRVSMEDPCYKVLPAALKKYNINAPWEQYALYIVYGDKERCLGMDEKPLILFKQLDKEGKKPMFMLRKISPPTDASSGDGPASAGLDLRNPGVRVYEPPGGII